MTSHDTIAAIATPLGEGGIGVVQVAGAGAIEVVAKAFRPRRKRDIRESPSGRLHYGHILGDEGVIDEAIVAVWQQGDGPPGCELAEVNCHGGIRAVRKTHARLIECGAASAEWQDVLRLGRRCGSFDTVQLEAALELPNAKTSRAAAMLLAQQEGELSRAVRNVAQAAEDPAMIDGLLATAPRGIALCHPKRLAVIGRPNVGKSTFVNLLLRHDRVIVHHAPGTTRDALEEGLAIDGVPFRIIDTAGLRHSDDEVERMGVAMARRQLEKADIVLAMFDGSEALKPEDRSLLQELTSASVIPIVTKADLPVRLRVEELADRFGSRPSVISAKTGLGLSEVENAILTKVGFSPDQRETGPVVFTHRQADLLETARRIADGKRSEERLAALMQVLEGDA